MPYWPQTHHRSTGESCPCAAASSLVQFGNLFNFRSWFSCKKNHCLPSSLSQHLQEQCISFSLQLCSYQRWLLRSVIIINNNINIEVCYFTFENKLPSDFFKMNSFFPQDNGRLPSDTRGRGLGNRRPGGTSDPPVVCTSLQPSSLFCFAMKTF